MTNLTNTIINQTNYPAISDELIKCLKDSFPNELPTGNLDSFELGKLIGHQEVIEKMVAEKDYNENEYKEEDED
jgi:hypothetical protein